MNTEPTQTETTQAITPKTPDFKHRCADFPENNIANATGQIETVLNFLYPLLNPAKMPEVSLSMIEDMHRNHENLKHEILGALFIIDSLNDDILAIAQAME
jgi:hypothetical protein